MAKQAAKQPIELLGAVVKDKVTGHQGIATSIIYMLSGSVQAHVDPGVGKDGKMRDSYAFDIDRLQFIKKGPVAPTPADDTSQITLGTTAKDRITELSGTITEKIICLNGCTLAVLTRKAADKEDKRHLVVDWKRLDLGDSKQVMAPPTTAPKGGPSRLIERGRY